MHLKFTFCGFQKYYDIYDSYRYEHKEILMNKSINLGFVVLDSTKLLMYGK